MNNIIKVISAIFLINLSVSIHSNAQTNFIINGGDVVMNNSFLILQNTKLTNNSNFHSGSATVTIKGDATNANSAIDGSSATTFYNLEINKTANGMQLGNDINVSNQLILTNGNLDLQSNDLTIQNTGSITGGSANSFVKTSNSGVLVQEVNGTNVVFPVGNTNYTPITINNSGTVDDFKVRTTDAVYTDGTSTGEITTGVVDCTWFVEEGTVGGSNVALTFQWNTADELTNFDRTQAFSSHYTGGAWTSNAVQSATGSNPYTLTEMGITSFSPFTIASDAGALPVELLYFYGEKIDKDILLSWETVTEIDNDYFDIEFSSDGVNFEKIGQMKGAGTTTEAQSYEFRHENPVDGSNYYRLKQMDFDEAFVYSNIILLNYESSNANAPVTIFPNPVIGEELNIIDGKGQATIYNLLGQPIKTFVINNERLMIDVSDFPDGQYILCIQRETGEVVTKKFIK